MQQQHERQSSSSSSMPFSSFIIIFHVSFHNRYSWKNSYQDAFISIASKVALFLNTMICVCVSKRHSLPLILCACEIYNIEAQLENKLCRAAWILHLQSHFSVINGVQTDLRLSYLEDITSLLETSFFFVIFCVCTLWNSVYNICFYFKLDYNIKI